MEVLPLAKYGLVRLGEQCDRFPTAVAPLLPPRDTTLGGFQRPFGFAIPTGREDACAIGESGEGFQSQVDPRLLASRWQQLDGRLGAGEGKILAIRLLRDGDGLGCPLDRTAPMHADAPDLREDQEPVVKSRAVAILLEGEGMIATPSFEAGKARLLSLLDATEERLIGPIQSRQHVLQHVRVDGGVCGKLSAQILQFRLLIVA